MTRDKGEGMQRVAAVTTIVMIFVVVKFGLWWAKLELMALLL